jgi:hypothetical protein
MMPPPKQKASSAHKRRKMSLVDASTPEISPIGGHLLKWNPASNRCQCFLFFWRVFWSLGGHLPFMGDIFPFKAPQFSISSCLASGKGLRQGHYSHLIQGPSFGNALDLGPCLSGKVSLAPPTLWSLISVRSLPLLRNLVEEPSPSQHHDLHMFEFMINFIWSLHCVRLIGEEHS